MAVNAAIANAWISIVPDTSGIAPGIKSALSNLDSMGKSAGQGLGSSMAGGLSKEMSKNATGAGKDAGAALGKAMDDAMSKAASNLGNSADDGLKKAAHKAGTGFGAELNDAVEKSTSGLGRTLAFGGVIGAVSSLTTSAIGAIRGLAGEAVAASDATDKFKKTLDFAGIDPGRLDELTAKARAYADATVYDLGDIQNMVAQLAANGVKDYDQLAEAAGNLNAVAGGNAETFKSVGMVMTQTAGQGKLTTENWNQLSDAIPGASGKIQEALLKAGAFTGNFRDAMSKGEITAEEFNAAVMEIGSQPVAVEATKSTETFEGMIGNLQAAITDNLADAMNQLKPEIGALVNGFTGFAVKALPKVVDGVKLAADWLSKTKTFLKENHTWVVPLAGAVVGLAGAYIGLSKAFAIADAAKAAGGLMAMFKATQLVTNMTRIWTGVQTAFNAVMALNPLVLIGVALAAVVAGLALFFTKTETGRELWQKFTDGLKAGWEDIKDAFNSGVEFVTGLWDGLVTKIQSFSGFFDALKVAFSTGWQIIKDIFATAWLALVAVFTGQWNEIPEIISAGWAAIKAHFSDGVERVKTFVVDMAANLFSKFSDIRSGTAAKVSELVEAVKQKFSDMRENVVGTVKELPEKIKGFFSDAGKWLVNAGRDVLNGLWDGLKQKWADVKNWLGGVKDHITGVFNRASSGARSQIGVAHANGSVVRYYANGGMEKHIAQIAPAGAWRVWAEPETGGEAYIPLAASKRARSTAILATVADKFGLTLVGRDGRALPASAARYVAATGNAFANGGIVSPDDLLRFAKGQSINGVSASRSLEGAPYVWGGSNWGDCSGAMSQFAAAASGAADWLTRKFATGSQGSWARANDFKSGLGSGARFAMGFFNGGPYGGHTAGTIFWADGSRVNVEMGGGRGNGQIGGNAAGADDPQFTDRYWIPLAGGSASSLDQIASTSTSGITTSSGANIDWGEAASAFSEAQKNRKFAAQMSRWRNKAFDSGGVANGLGFLPKATIKPERVLSPSQTVAFEKLPAVLTGLASALGMSAHAQTSSALALSNVASAVKGFTAKDALAYGEKLGFGDITGLFKGSVSAWEDMEKSFVAQVDAADGLQQAEKNLAAAREEYSKALADDNDLTVKQKRRLEDAYRAVEDASKPNKKGVVNRDKVERAKERLRRVEDDIEAEQKKAGKKKSDQAKKAAQNLLKAENDLADARETVTAVAKAAGHAEIAMAIEVFDTVAKVVDKIVGAVMAARSAVAIGLASMMESVKELSVMSDKLRDSFLTAQVEAAAALVKVNASARGVRMAQLDGVKAQLEASKTVADLQKKLSAQRKADARAAAADYRDLSISYDQWVWNLRKGTADAMGEMVAWSNESRALNAELQAAVIGRQIAEKQAQLDVLKNVFEHQKAVLDLEQATTGLRIAAEKLATMSGKAFGFDSVEATVGTRYTNLLAEKAKLQADQASIKTWINPVNWFTSMPAAQKRIHQIDEELAKLAAMPEFKAFTPEQLSEVGRLQAKAGAMGFFGAGDKVADMIKNSALGNAARALDQAKWEQELIDVRHARDQSRQKLEEKRLEVDKAERLAPIESVIDQLKASQGAQKTWAEYWREDDKGVRAALADLARFQENPDLELRRLSDSKQVVTINMPAGKTSYTAEEVVEMVGETNKAQKVLDLRVGRLENPPVAGSAVALARKVVI